MADVVPSEIEKTKTADVSVSKPASGTYGEKADLARLKAQLPQGGQPVGQPGGPTPMNAPPQGQLPSPPGRPAAGVMPPGVPDALGHPTARPGIPLTQPLSARQGSPVSQAESARDARIALLMALKDSPEVSDVTREWAGLVLEMLNG